MYNSFIVRVLAKLWNIFVFGYEKSITKKIIDSIKKFTIFLFKGSIVKDIFVKDNKIIPKSIFYKIYSWILDKISILLKRINSTLRELGENSIVYRSIYSLFKSDKELINTISVFVISFSIGIILNNLRLGLIVKKSNIIGVILILGSFLIIRIKDDFKSILLGAYHIRFVRDLFSIDKGGEKWW